MVSVIFFSTQFGLRQPLAGASLVFLRQLAIFRGREVILIFEGTIKCACCTESGLCSNEPVDRQLHIFIYVLAVPHALVPIDHHADDDNDQGNSHAGGHHFVDALLVTGNPQIAVLSKHMIELNVFVVDVLVDAPLLFEHILGLGPVALTRIEPQEVVAYRCQFNRRIVVVVLVKSFCLVENMEKLSYLCGVNTNI